MRQNIILNFSIFFLKHINGKYKGNNSKNRTYYFLDEIIDIKNFGSNLLKIDKKSYKNIDIYYIGYVIK